MLSRATAHVKQDSVLHSKGLCNCIVNTWALKGLLSPYFGAYVCAIMILGPFRAQLPAGMGRFSLKCSLYAHIQRL